MGGIIILFPPIGSIDIEAFLTPNSYFNVTYFENYIKYGHQSSQTQVFFETSTPFRIIGGLTVLMGAVVLKEVQNEKSQSNNKER